MLLSLFIDDIEKEKLISQGKDIDQLEQFLAMCFISSFSFFIIGFIQYTVDKSLAPPFYLGVTLFLLQPFLIKWFKLYKLTRYLLPISFIAILSFLGRLDPQLNSPLFLWFYFIPYMSLQCTKKTHGLTFATVGLLVVFISRAQFYGLSLSLAQQMINTLVPYSLVTFLSIYFHKEARTNKKLSKEKQDIADESKKTKDAFWANISHEIRTPLNGIMGMTHLLSESPMRDEQREILNIIRTSSENLNLILSGILDYSKLQTGHLTTEKKPFHLRETIEHVINLFSHMARQKRIHLSYIIDPDVPSGILSDPNRLKQVLANLISNALKFTESGSIKVIVEKFDRKETLRFSVLDTGIGISQENIDKIFTPFTQLDSRSTRKYGGTGLGLVISSKIVNLMGGHIEVESQVGHGSCFSFTLTALPTKVQQTRFLEHGEQKDSLSNITRKVDLNILVVEDNPVNQRLIVALLKKNGYQPTVASDGLEALKAFDNNFYNLVFMDIQMPRMDGITATEKILAKYSDTPPKIVAVTANALQEDRDRCFNVGMDDFLTKPINSNLLKSLLDRYSNQVVEVHDILDNMEKREHSSDQDEMANLSTIEYKTLDLFSLLKYFDHDLEVIMTIHDQFKSRYPKDLELLSDAATNGDTFQLSAVAHSLKGSLATLHSNQGVHMTKDLESMHADHDIEEISRTIEELSSHCEKLSEELDIFLQQKASA